MFLTSTGSPKKSNAPALGPRPTDSPAVCSSRLWGVGLRGDRMSSSSSSSSAWGTVFGLSLRARVLLPSSLWQLPGWAHHFRVCQEARAVAGAWALKPAAVAPREPPNRACQSFIFVVLEVATRKSSSTTRCTGFSLCFGPGVVQEFSNLFVQQLHASAGAMAHAVW